MIQKDVGANEILKPFLQGRDIQAFAKPTPKSNLILFEKGFTKSQIGEIEEVEAWEWLKSKYPSICEWLQPFEQKGKKRTDKGDFWWELRACDYYPSFQKPKIMYQKFQVKPCFIYDEKGFYCNDSMWIIPTENKGLVGVLNSKMGWWLITKYCTQIQNGCQLIWKYFGQIPVPNLQGELDEYVTSIMNEHEDLDQITTNFLNLVQSKFSIDKPSRKLQNWHEYSFADFTKELKKNKVKLSLGEESEWMQYFNNQKAKAQSLHSQIKRTEKEIDHKVYELYGLTEKEIAMVENSI